MQTSRSFNWYTRMWRAWITQPFNSTVTYGQLNMLHLKSVGESLVVPYGGSNIFFMIFEKYSVLHTSILKEIWLQHIHVTKFSFDVHCGWVFILFLGKSPKWTLKNPLKLKILSEDIGITAWLIYCWNDWYRCEVQKKRRTYLKYNDKLGILWTNYG